MFDFFYGDSEQYMFYRVPQILFTDDRFKLCLVKQNCCMVFYLTEHRCLKRTVG